MNKNISAGMYKMENEQRMNSDDHCAARSLYTNSYWCGTIYQNGTTKEIRELFGIKKEKRDQITIGFSQNACFFQLFVGYVS
jgi:hypothetical protein